MKLGFYHYYFKERARRLPPRICHDINPLLRAYLAYENNDWKAKIETDDGETLLLLQTSTPHVLMLVGTRQQDIIKAIDTKRMTCEDLEDRFTADEKAGFVAYFIVGPQMLGLASTLRGPKTAALARLIGYLLHTLGAQTWKLGLVPLGTSVSLQQALQLAFISRTSVKVRPGNPFFARLANMTAVDSDQVDSFEVIVRGRKNRNIKDVVRSISDEANAGGLDKMTVRARAVLDDDLADYFVAAEGRLTEDIEPGIERAITQRIASTFHRHTTAPIHLQEILNKAHYEIRDVPELTRLGDVDFWRQHLLPVEA